MNTHARLRCHDTSAGRAELSKVGPMLHSRNTTQKEAVIPEALGRPRRRPKTPGMRTAETCAQPLLLMLPASLTMIFGRGLWHVEVDSEFVAVNLA
jgi:hypothetical protein